MSVVSETESQGLDKLSAYLPTYRTEPEENEKFYPSKVKSVVESVLQEKIIATTKYDEKEAEQLSKSIADSIRQKVTDDLQEAQSDKEIPSRYKLVVQVVVGQMGGQGVRFASRCLWNASTDNYVSASYSNDYLFCTVLVAGLYTD